MPEIEMYNMVPCKSFRGNGGWICWAWKKKQKTIPITDRLYYFNIYFHASDNLICFPSIVNYENSSHLKDQNLKRVHRLQFRPINLIEKSGKYNKLFRKFD